MTTKQSLALRALKDTLSERPIDHKRLQDAVIAFVRSRRSEETPERIITGLKATFDDLVRSDYTGAYALRSQAASWAIQEYYWRPEDGGE
ncbi:MAG: hypothetical protein ACT4PJ_13915 [Gemmatimonadaceae bacterium]